MSENQGTNNLVTYLMIGLLVVGSYLIGVYKTKADMMENGSTKVAQVQGEAENQPIEQVTELDETSWNKVMENAVYQTGQENAPVTIVEFTDYQCPYCKRYSEETMTQIFKNYVDSGKVRYMMRDLPLPFHPNAIGAAVAARCGGKEGKYLEMHDLLFLNQEVWSDMADPSAEFISYGRELGIDIARCITDESVQEDVQEDVTLAGQVGAGGTPTFFVNGKIVVGAQPYASFEEIIEAELE